MAKKMATQSARVSRNSDYAYDHDEELPFQAASVIPPERIQKLAEDLGKLVEEKQRQYGNSVEKSERILRLLYPNGIHSSQYEDVLLVVRILDKLSRIAQSGWGQDAGGESPFTDIAGYGLLGMAKEKP